MEKDDTTNFDRMLRKGKLEETTWDWKEVKNEALWPSGGKEFLGEHTRGPTSDQAAKVQ